MLHGTNQAAGRTRPGITRALKFKKNLVLADNAAAAGRFLLY